MGKELYGAASPTLPADAGDRNRAVMRLFLLVPALVLSACGPSGSPTPQAEEGKSAPAGSAARPQIGLDRSHAGTPAPATAFQNPDGGEASLADFAGKPLLLNLWATWCAPCIKELPTLDALAAREGGKLQLVTLAQDDRGKVETFLAARSLPNVEAWLDPELEMMAALGVSTLPTTILYDAQGRERWRMVGMEEWDSGRAALLLKEGFSPEAIR